MALIMAEGLVRALKWICRWVGQGEHQPASQVAGSVVLAVVPVPPIGETTGVYCWTFRILICG